MKLLLLSIFLFTLGCKEEPQATEGIPLPPSARTSEISPARDSTQPKIVSPGPLDLKFDTKLQHIQEQVNWVDKRIGP